MTTMGPAFDREYALLSKIEALTIERDCYRVALELITRECQAMNKGPVAVMIARDALAGKSRQDDASPKERISREMDAEVQKMRASQETKYCGLHKEPEPCPRCAVYYSDEYSDCPLCETLGAGHCASKTSKETKI